MTEPQWPTPQDFAVITAAEYSEMQQELAQEASSYILKMLKTIQGRSISQVQWQMYLHLMYEFVSDMRTKAAELGREFYDSQRQLHVGLPKNTYLDNYKFEQFEDAMRPAYRKIATQDGSENAISDGVLRALKEIENGGRRTILSAVEDDKRAVGWARIATGRETCGFCLMLVSRGVNRGSGFYRSARSAGLDASNEQAERLYHDGDWDTISSLMVKWHPGCDCKVVPVFDRQNWPGRDAQLRAAELWNEVTKGFSSKDALNAFRRAVENGDLDLDEYATAA